MKTNRLNKRRNCNKHFQVRKYIQNKISDLLLSQMENIYVASIIAKNVV